MARFQRVQVKRSPDGKEVIVPDVSEQDLAAAYAGDKVITGAGVASMLILAWAPFAGIVLWSLIRYGIAVLARQLPHEITAINDMHMDAIVAYARVAGVATLPFALLGFFQARLRKYSGVTARCIKYFLLPGDDEGATAGFEFISAYLTLPITGLVLMAVYGWMDHVAWVMALLLVFSFLFYGAFKKIQDFLIDRVSGAEQAQMIEWKIRRLVSNWGVVKPGDFEVNYDKDTKIACLTTTVKNREDYQMMRRMIQSLPEVQVANMDGVSVESGVPRYQDNEDQPAADQAQ